MKEKKNLIIQHTNTTSAPSPSTMLYRLCSGGRKKAGKSVQTLVSLWLVCIPITELKNTVQNGQNKREKVFCPPTYNVLKYLLYRAFPGCQHNPNPLLIGLTTK
jgi:hypothetical protein